MASNTAASTGMLELMPRRSSREKTIVNARVDTESMNKLDEIAISMRPQASRSQMIELAIIEFIERHESAKESGKKSSR